ncbi:MAG TPA: sulfite exporter TauE/SafE family protein [Gammaproteobacteria bacterium]|nr:sulfite exporter TauE/SafE family protein [Gammaproteobacteria bacterium]
MPDIEWIFAFLLLGGVVGFVAGLLGIGGGGIMVPVLTSIFLLQDVPVENAVHLALGTSMASIVMTSLSSLRTHNSHHGVLWHIVGRMAPGIMIGAFCGTLLVPYLSAIDLAIFFTLFMAYVAFQMFFDKKPNPTRQLTANSNLLLAGGGIGCISALVSLGGGSLTVPYLIWHNIEVKRAIGTSAAIGFPLSITGSIGYLVNGWGKAIPQEYTLGYIYLPAVLFISVASYYSARYGAKLVHKLPVKALKKAFSVLLMLLSIQMLISII